MDTKNIVSIDILKRQSRRTITPHVTEEGLVEVRAPRFAPMFVIENFVRSRTDWISKAKASALEHRKTKRQYAEGEIITIAGKPYVLHMTKGNSIVKAGSRVFFPEKFIKTPQKHIEAWLRTEAKKILSERVTYYARIMDVPYKKITIRDTSSRWGSCSHDGSINFSYRLILADLPVIDYVVVHELTHVTHHHHKASFWDRVGEFFPDYRVRRAWLRNKGHTLRI